MKPIELQELLHEQGLSLHVFSARRKNQFRITRGFFFRHGLSETDLEKDVSKALIEAGLEFRVIDRGEHYHDFVGGAKAGSAQDCFWYVLLEIIEKKEKE